MSKNWKFEFRPLKTIFLLLGIILVFVAISNRDYTIGGMGIAFCVFDIKLQRRS